MTTLHVVDTGALEGPPIVWLGSLGSSTAMWDRQVDAFGDRYRCVLIDHPGHGASPPTADVETIDSLTDGVLAAVDGLGLDRTHVVGLSLGAMIAMNVAARHPDRVDRLALMCTTAHFGNQEFWSDRAATVRADGLGGIADGVVARWLTAPYATAHPDEAAMFVAMLTGTDPESYARCSEAIGAMDQRDHLPRVKAPTLLIAGALDPATPPTHAEVIAELIPGARLELLPAAHFANWELAGAVNDLLGDHLDRNSDG